MIERLASPRLRVFVFAVPVLLLLGACGPGGVFRAANSGEGVIPLFPRFENNVDIDAFSPPPPRPERRTAAGPFENTATVTPSMTDAEIAAMGQVAVGSPQPSNRPRLLGNLFQRVPGEVPAPAAPEAEVQVAAANLTPPTAEPVSRLGWLFGGRGDDVTSVRSAGLGSDNQPVRGVVGGLPFGEVVTVCGVTPRNLGTEVARSEGPYRLYDSDPTSTQERPQFLTGFKDNCARQFTASLAMFGSAGVHEATRYNPLNTNPYSKTDQAYENVKIRLCGVGRGTECPDKRVSKLEKKAAFVSVYKGFGDSGEWLEMFLHDGKVVAYESRVN